MFKTSFVPTNLFTFTVCLIITRLATSFQIDIVFLFWWQCDGGDDDDDNSIDNCSEEVVLVKVMMMMMIYTFKYSSDSGSHNKFSFVEFCNSYRVILRKSPKYSIYFRDLPCWYWTVYIHMGFEVARLVRESFLLAVLVYIHIHTDTHTHTHTHFFHVTAVTLFLNGGCKLCHMTVTTCCWYHKDLLWL